MSSSTPWNKETKSRMPSQYNTLLFVGMLFVKITSMSFAYVVPQPRQTVYSRRTGRVPRGASFTRRTRLHVQSPKDIFTPKAAASRKTKQSKTRRTSKRSKNSQQPYNRNTNYNNKALAQAKAVNQAMVKCQTPMQVLQLLANTGKALTGLAGGGDLNSVNFSTALHRIAKNASQNRDNRAMVLSDARFALLLCSTSEALVGMDYTKSLSALQEQVPLPKNKKTKRLAFKSREFSNIAWAIAKLRIAPPSSALPVDATSKSIEDVLQTSLKLRNEILEVAKKRKNSRGAATPTSPKWIPTLSKLSGHLLDAIAHSLFSLTCDFNSQEWANLLWAMATAGRADQDVFDVVVQRLVAVMKQEVRSNITPRPQQLSNSLWSFATAGFHGAAQENLVDYVAELLDADSNFLLSFKPQELSNTVWAIATILSNKRSNKTDSASSKTEDLVVLRVLRHVARAITERAGEFKSQELSNTVWAFATLGFGHDGTGVFPGASLNDYIFLESDDPEGDIALVSSALNAVAKSALPRLHTFRSQELNNLAWAFSRLGGQETAEQVFVGIGNEFQHNNRYFSSQDIGTTLWSFASKEYSNDDVYKAMCSGLSVERGQQFKPQEVSNVLWALATAQVEPKYLDAFDTTLVPPNQRLSLKEMSDDPVVQAFAAGARELMRRPHQFKPQEIKDVLWSFSKIGLRHPPLFKYVAEHLVGKEEENGNCSEGRGTREFTPQGIGNLSWSYAKQAQMTEMARKRIEAKSAGNTGRLAIYATSCIDLGEDLLQRLFTEIADTALNNHGRLSKLKPQDMSNTAWSFATLGLWHESFFDAVAEQVIERSSGKRGRGHMERFKGQEIANLIWAFATLNHPFRDVIDAVTTSMIRTCSYSDGTYDAKSIAQQFKRQELGNVVWSIAVAGHYPPELVHLLYTGLLGSGDEMNPEYLCQVHGDDGLQKQGMTSLLYLQMIMDIEMPDNDLALPANFPDGWDNDVSSLMADDSDGLTEETSLLNLSSSKMQKDVSAVLDRIGFHHVEEHVITTEELVQNHGIKVSTDRLEILSIDIANLQDKIAIEVDGPGHFAHELENDDKRSQEQQEGFRNRGFAKLINGKLEWQFNSARQHVNGSTALKERLLTHLGWKLLHLPYWAWYSIEGNKAEEDEYVESLLESAE